MITTHRKGKTIGVNRDGKPVGVVHDLGKGAGFSIFLYTKECPWDAHAGVVSTAEEAIEIVGRRGQTPDYMDKD